MGAVAVTILIVGSFPGPTQAEPVSQLVYDNGNVVVNLLPTAASDCPLDWVCLWENPDFLGRMVQYRDCCPWYNLADVGLNNAASSWRNRKSVDAKVADFADGNGNRLCLNNGSQSSSMGAWDNQATSIKIFSGSGAC